ncbi:MAG: GNAT family N-acetyltransferase [Chlamydiota bacterium]|nr:GNAT family N-acetyltransferase [Chlamydiota bacterium]
MSIDTNTIQFQNISDIKSPNDQLSIITKINSSVDGWSNYTRHIHKNYLGNPNSYQIFKIAKIAGEALAYIIVRPEYYAEDVSYISYIAVDSTNQKKGVGSLLLKHALDILKEHNIKKVKLDCRPNTSAFYEKFCSNHKLHYTSKKIGTYLNGNEKNQITFTF